jgi:hypothetical protein
MSQSHPPPPIYDDFPQNEVPLLYNYHPIYDPYSSSRYETQGELPSPIYYFDQNQFPQGYDSHAVCYDDSNPASDQKKSSKRVKHGMSKRIYKMERKIYSIIRSATPSLKKIDDKLCNVANQINQSLNTFFKVKKK